MKILHIGDMHLGKVLNGYSLIEDQRYVLDQIINIQCDTILIAGDVYDRSVPSAEAINIFEDFINKIVEKKRNVIIISGNHDSADRLGFLSNQLKKANIYIKTEIDFEPIKINDVNFYLFPFKTLYELKKQFELDFHDTNEAYKYMMDKVELQDGYNVLVMHDYVTAGMELETSDSERPINVGGSEYIDFNIFNQFDYVAMGHIHGPQRVGRDMTRYAGSIMKYSFSEVRHQKSCVLLDTNSNSYSLINLTPLRDMVILKTSIDEALSKSFYMQYNVDNDYFRIELSDSSVVDAQNRLKAVYKNLMEIKVSIPEVAKIEKIDIDKSYDTLELFCNFFKTINNEELSFDDQEIIKSALEEVLENAN